MNILGYADKFSVMQNESIEFKVSCQNIKKYNAALLKIVQGDINDKGPGYKEIKLKDNLGGPFNARYQKIPIGSYGIIRNKKIFHKLKNLSLSVFIFPTLLKRGRKQVILSRKNNNGFELFINNEDKIQFNINNYNIKLKKKISEKNWYFITAKYNSKNGSVYISEELVFKQNENNVININKIENRETEAPDLSRDYGPLSAPPKLSHFPMRIWNLEEDPRDPKMGRGRDRIT